ncbi:hypothetical protein Lal_00022085 [Lupinus albus]|nr:hypothetical protein Lal_00022085 [Lupinus albus]
MYISDAFNHHVIDYQDCVIDYTVSDAQPQIAISRLGETTLTQARILQYSPGFHPPRKHEIDFFITFELLLPHKRICVGTGLLAALRTQLQEWSNAESFYCIRHLASNFNKEFRNPDLKDKVIEMGYELIRPRFERMLSALHEKNPRAGAWLDNIPKAKSAQCYDEGRRVLKGSRALPIIALVQTTYYRLNSWFVDHRDEAVNMIKAGHIYCEELTNVIKENQLQSTCQLVRSFSRETGVAEVEAPSRFGGRHSKVYTVKLTDSWSDCEEFQSLRLPCSHAIATCSNLNLDYFIE